MLNVIVSYMPYALITTFTPGPNNIMSLYAVSSSGWKKGGRVISGIFAGFACLTVMVILFCRELSVYAPKLTEYLKYAGAVYILWLAYHIAASEPSETQEHSLSFRSGLLLALSNVKVILYLITIFIAFIIPAGASSAEMFMHGALIIAIAAASWFTWGTAGGLMQKFLNRYYRAFNITMGIILLWCAVQIIM